MTPERTADTTEDKRLLRLGPVRYARLVEWERAHPRRCTLRKHVIENGTSFCDCGEVMLQPTAARNARVVTLFAVNSTERALASQLREAIKP